MDNGLACDLMKHYMGATGGDYLVDVDRLLKTPEFGAAVGKTLGLVGDRAVEMCNGPVCNYTFDSGWTAMEFEQDRSESEFFAYRGMTYQVRGSVVVTRDANGNAKTSGSYSVTAYKSWNFDRREELRGVPFSGPADAAGFGLAREFAVVGTSRYHPW